jgi:hypothetical protein
LNEFEFILYAIENNKIKSHSNKKLDLHKLFTIEQKKEKNQIQILKDLHILDGERMCNVSQCFKVYFKQKIIHQIFDCKSFLIKSAKTYT